MNATHGKAAIRRFVDGVWNAGELDLVDELVAADYIGHHGAPSHQTLGREGLRRRVAAVRREYPDLEVRIDDELAEEDRVVTRWTARGRQLEVSGVSVFRMLAGRQVESWTYWAEP
ncbi:MAG TPA: ester cyclase [Thermoleophilaceae bacterium]|jgi:hypothetical protein